MLYNFNLMHSPYKNVYILSTNVNNGRYIIKVNITKKTCKS